MKSDADKISSCDGKFGYDNYTTAQIAQDHRKKPGKGKKLQIYLCRFCKKYHLGSTA